MTFHSDRELVPDGFKTVEYDGFVSSYQRQLYPCSSMCSNRCSWSYSIQFHCKKKTPNLFNFFLFHLQKVVTDLYLLGAVWLFFFNISCNPMDLDSNVSEVLNQSIVLKPFFPVFNHIYILFQWPLQFPQNYLDIL